MSMNGILVPLDSLPSRGIPYPEDISLFVKPLKIKDQIDMERYGITDAEYFRILLEGINIEGNFKKEDLIHFDVQFLDLARRLFSFDTDEAIIIKDLKCSNPDCGASFDYSFKIQDIEFEDLDKEIFGKHVKLGEGTDDELELVISPLTVSEYMKMSRALKNYKDKRTLLSSMYSEYVCYCTKEVVGRQFKDMKDRDSYLKGYIDDLYRAKDKKIIRQITDDTIIKIKPFKHICDDCEEETEVIVTPSSNFQQ